MSAVLKDPTDHAIRVRLVREIAKLKADGEGRGAQLAARFYQAEHDTKLAREAVDKAVAARNMAASEWGAHSSRLGAGIASLEKELLATAPRTIDAAIADLELAKERFRQILPMPIMVTMSDGTRQPSPEDVANLEHSRSRWEALNAAIVELLAMKLEALSEADLRKRLDTIQGRAAASMYRETTQ